MFTMTDHTNPRWNDPCARCSEPVETGEVVENVTDYMGRIVELKHVICKVLIPHGDPNRREY